MLGERMSVDELADAVGLSRRAIRFYVQQKLLPPPLGSGRGSHYDLSHLERLRRLQQLQEQGHSLEAIAQILEGKAMPSSQPPRPASRAPLTAELWTRLRVADGIELHLDTLRHDLDAQQLGKLRDVIREIVKSS